MAKLFEPIQLKSIHLKNRIVVSPMCQYSAVDGYANNWHLVHLGSRAVGGAGLVISEATAVSPEGRISPEDLGIWEDGHIDKLREITSFIKENGAVAGIQLAHAGRKASTYAEWRGKGKVVEADGGWQPVGPSALAFADDYAVPTVLDQEGIEKVKADFGEAARRALLAGFEVLEIHAAHGYLLYEFLSPLSNQRTDAYGGSFDNRIRLLLEVLRAVQGQWPSHLPIFVRISATEWTDGGWDLEQTVALAKILKERGVDVIDASSGGNVADAKIPIGAGYQVPFASAVKKQVGITTGAVGLITSAAQAETILVNRDADLIFLARELLRNPYWPLHAAKELHVDLAWPNQYRRAK
ncbi:NADH:flavin oxidoreductase/NADH oxidase [Olivibacter sitiensis]|uniref:NADH:flavin oxidoreductase/NADH oxidase n=1 Tax=Olivibacter sitiensis TaxID=376470 RepID=UPI000414A892|nr:NADH:flavin oxidoreductase/NADH oxidase [Olivibacter sitiensis]